MNNWIGKELCEKSIGIVIESLIRNKNAFKMIEKRGSIYIYLDEKLAYRYHKTKCLDNEKNFNEIIPIITAIRKNIDRYIDNHKEGIEPVQKNERICRINIDNYKNLKLNSVFYEFDIQEAYFQAVYKLKYISPKLFHKYNHFEQFKNAYIYGITWLQCDEIVKEYKKGKVVNEYNKFRPQYKIIYDNIRYYINNLADEAISCIDPQDFIKKQVDAIYCTEESYEKICSFFQQKGIEIKCTLLIKKNDTEYIKGDQVKKI